MPEEITPAVRPEHSTLMRFMMTSVKFKCLVLFGMLALIFLFFSLRLATFNSTDPIPAFNIIDEARQKAFGAFTVKIKTGLFIRNFSAFDVIKNNFSADCIVWFEFPSDEIQADIIGNFSFENGKIVSRSAPDIKINGNRTFVKYEVRVEFKSNLTYYKFPFEDHKITMVLSNNFLTPFEAVFLIDNNSFVVAPTIFVSNWALKDLETDTGYQSSNLDAKDEQKQALYPLVSYTMRFAKAGIRKVLIIFIPLFLAIILSLLSFFLTLANLVGRATLSVSAVTALLGYRFVIENMMPEVGYFTTTDFIYIVLLLVSLLVFIIQTMFSRYTTIIGLTERGFASSDVPHGPDAAFQLECVNTVIFLIVVGLTVGATGYLVLY